MIVKKKQAGFTLLEVIVSLGLLIMVFGGVTSLAILSHESQRAARNNLIAVNLAKEAEHLVRYKRDLNYILTVSPFTDIATEVDNETYDFTVNYDLTFAAAGTSDVTQVTPLGHTGDFYAQGSGTATIFRRLVTTTYHAAAGPLPARIDVVVKVYWKEDTKSRTYISTSELTDWR